MRVGILGGVFNPPHVGHLVCAQEAHHRLELDAVTLVPVGEAPHRTVEQDPGGAARLELCELAVRGDPRLRVSSLEVERDGPSYTVETLMAMKELDPRIEPVLILGADQAAALAQWRRPEDVVALCEVAVADRGDVARRTVTDAATGVGGGERIGFFDMPRIDVSSTLVRERIAAGEPIRYLVPDPVAELISERGLYRAPAAVASAG